MKHKSYRALALGLAAAQLVPFGVYSAFAETNEAALKNETAPVTNEAATAENDQVKDVVIVKAPEFATLKSDYTAADVETKALVVTSYYSGKITVTAVTLTEGADKFELVANGTNVEITSGAADSKSWTIRPKTGLAAGTTHTGKVQVAYKYTEEGGAEKTSTTTCDIAIVIAEAGAVELTDTNVSIGNGPFTYAGEVIEPEVTINAGEGKTLVKDTDYTVTYANNDKPGTNATVTVTAKSAKCIGEVEKTFTIEKGTQAKPTGTLKAEMTSTTATLSGVEESTANNAGKLQYKCGDGEWQESPEFTGLTPKTEYTFSARYAGNEYYNASDVVTATGTTLQDVDPTKVDIKDAVVTIADADKQVYDGKAKTPAVTVKLGETALTAETDYSVDYTDNVNAGTATVTVTGKGNYTGTATASFEIAKADQPAPAVPELSAKSKSSITIKAVADSAVTGAKAEYSIDEGKTWQDDTTFTGLRSSRRYEIIARYKATDNYNESSASDPLTVTTSSSGSGSGGSIGGGGGGSYRPSRPSTPSEPSPSAPTIPGGDSGWSNIGSDIGKSEPGSNVTINLNGDATVPADVLVAAANKDVKLTLKVDETYTWEIDGANISGQVSSADFSVKNDTVPAQAVTNPALMNCDSTKAINVTGVPFAYKPVLTANFGTKAAGEFVNLYKVDPATGALEFAGVTQIGADGNAVIPVTENGKYVIAVDNETKMMGDFDNSMGVNAFDAASLLKEITSVQTTGAYKGDVDGDGKVDVWDAVKILKMIVGLE